MPIIRRPKWYWIVLLACLVIIWLLASLYFAVMKDEKELVNEAIKKAEKTYGPVEVIDIEHYFGTNAYRIIEAINAEGKVYIFVPETSTGKLLTIKASAGITKENAKGIALKRKNVQDIIDVRLAIENDMPLWEIVYEDEFDDRTYLYLLFKNGKFYKRYTISK
jgi:uncharacterized protein YpmB